MILTIRTLMIICLALALPACGDSRQEEAGQDPGHTASAAASSAAAASVNVAEPDTTTEDDDLWMDVAELPETNVFEDSWTGDFDAMAERRLIRILTVYSVGRYYLDEGQEKGLTYELGKTFENFVNKKSVRGHLRVNVVFIPVARNQLIPALLAGHGDLIAASLSITPERQKQVDFTLPISRPLSEILVTGPSAPELKDIEDLSGRTLYVRHSSSYRESAEELNRRLTAAGKRPVEIEFVSEMLEDDDLIEMVAGGLLPWAIVDNYKTQLWDGVFDSLEVREDIVFKSGTELAWAMRKNSPRLLELSNEFVKKNRIGTLTGNVLANRYIRDFDWAANALENNDYARFNELEEIFRSFGQQYGIDHLMLAAQGYQESRLDQTMRSRAGAIGIMQVLPSTASDPNVNIRNISEAEGNIHAGTKYLNYLRNRYFVSPDIEEQDQTLLALAAYNAGPRRMINLRNKADKLGYDSNKWFDNVEVVAARDIGRETVQYVSNIFKYHIAYRLSQEQNQKRAEAREKVGITRADEGPE
jgi:membrane-bound lytic murein transglycosylase MltF